jgi:Uri superfamily endonuclease
VLRCASTRAIRVGRLGTIRLRPGYYLYIGSAFGPGGLRARVAHHHYRAKRPHWHVDYLRRYARLESVWYASGARREHDWAAKVAAMPGAAMVLPGFGSSDCRCETHLYWFVESPVAELRGVVGGESAVIMEPGSHFHRRLHVQRESR